MGSDEASVCTADRSLASVGCEDDDWADGGFEGAVEVGEAF